MPQIKLQLNLPAIEADLVRIGGEEFAVIKAHELMKLFDPMQRVPQQEQQRPAMATNGKQKWIPRRSPRRRPSKKQNRVSLDPQTGKWTRTKEEA